MITRKLFYIVFIIQFFPLYLFAQTPAIDPNWQLNTAYSDEFNDTITRHDTVRGINDGNWHKNDYRSLDANLGGATAFDSLYAYDSIIGGNGYLMLKVDSSLNTTIGSWTCNTFCSGLPGYCNFNTGGLTSKHKFSYGYFEIYAKLPGFIDGSGHPHGDKFWPTFWMAYNPNCSIHNEIDVMDQCCNAYRDTKTTGSGWNYAIAGCHFTSGGGTTYVSPVPLCSAFHKFALEWNTNRMVFYRDDMPYYQQFNDTGFVMNPQEVLITLQLTCDTNFYPGTFPASPHHSQFMTVDYFHYHTLKLDCGIDSTFNNNSGITTFPYEVMNSITFGNGTSNIVIGGSGGATPQSGKQFVFRAVNYFKIPNDGKTFTVNTGNQFMLVPTACN